jgi:pantoate--beta-alanine ligase
VVFAPAVDEVYHADRSIIILEKSLSTVLCGASRPGHFDGVCTVVAKLFNYFQPDDAVFGKKDYQQLAIIRRMVRDLNFPIVLHGIDTVREADGLAMSSRNRYLSPEERAQAPALRRALLAMREAWLGGERSTTALKQVASAILASDAPVARLDYLEVCDTETLQDVETVGERKCVIAIAAFFGKARLIDNLELV